MMARQQDAGTATRRKNDRPEPRSSARPVVQLCPDCASADTRPSRKKGLLVGILKRLKFARYKCLTCNRRFYASV